MALSRFGLVVGQRSFVSLSFAAMLGAATVAHAQQPAQPAAGGQAGAAPAPAANAQPDVFKFTTDAGGMIWTIQPDKTADFESVWDAIRAKCAASDNPDLKALGASLHLYKVEPSPGTTPTSVTYVIIADPASKTLSYAATPYLLFTSKLFTDQEGRELFAKLSGALVPNTGINAMPLDIVH